MRPRKLHVYIIESAQDDAEAAVLQKKLACSSISIMVRIADDKRAFLSALRSAMTHFIAHRSSFPILHISAHGCEKGIWMSNNDFITWDEFGAAIGSELSDRLILCMSTCEGLRSWGMALLQSLAVISMAVGQGRRRITGLISELFGFKFLLAMHDHDGTGLLANALHRFGKIEFLHIESARRAAVVLNWIPPGNDRCITSRYMPRGHGS